MSSTSGLAAASFSRSVLNAAIQRACFSAFTSAESQQSTPPSAILPYRPLRTLHFAALTWITGQPRPMLFHLANVVWHAAACVLLMVLAWRPQPVSDTNSGLQVRAEVINARELVHRWRGGRSYAGPLIPGDDDDADIAEAADAVPSWMLAAVSIEKKTSTSPAAEDEVWEDN